MKSLPSRAPKPKKRAAKKPRARERLHVDERRGQLLAAALTAFSEQPYDEVSLDDIAATVGISRPLIFHYFPTKRDFYVATMQTAASDFLASTMETPGRTPFERLELGLDAHFHYVEGHAKGYSALLRGGIGSDPEILGIVELTRSHILQRIRVELPEEIRDDPRLRAALRGWIGFMEAISLDWIDHRDLARAELKALALQALAALLGEHASNMLAT
ncbi:TetR/AcrR family transcriptional regulator [Pendulispora albinea]|uniref:TetR/AcrR family transcriptional regulator n=1 Tax=Pendulispora albinea TaxID=2741071 RepID=A0ABZ2LST6_9BACT